VPPLAVQPVAPTAIHDSEVDPPLSTEVRLAFRILTTGAAGVTNNGALAIALPPAPVQVNVYEYRPAMLSVPVLTLVPSRGCDPLQDPEAVQESALSEDQVRAAELPATICSGVTSMFTTGGGAKPPTINVTVLAVLPPAPLHVNVYE
jgi:hypothetical protein